MAQAKRDALESRSNRLKRKPQAAPYWSKLTEGQYLGYFRALAPRLGITDPAKVAALKMGNGA